MFENNNNNNGNNNFNNNNNYGYSNSSNNNYVNPGSGDVNTYYQVKKAPKKGKGVKIAVISGVTAAALAGGGVAAYHYSPFVKNQVKLRTMDSEDYYSWVNEENVRSLSKKYGSSVSRYEDGQHTNLTLSYEPSADVKDMLKDDLGGSKKNRKLDSESQEALEQLEKIIDNTDNISVALDSVIKEGNVMLSMSGLRNDDKLISYEFLLDNEASDIFMRVPELSEEWIGFSLDEYLDELRGENEYLDKLLDARVDIMKSPSSYLSQEELEEELVRYVNIWSDTVDDVKVVKSKNVKIGDIETSYTVASVTIDRELAVELAKNYIEAARDDEIIKGLVIEKLGLVDEDQYLDTFDELLIDLEEANEETTEKSTKGKNKKSGKYEDEDDEDEGSEESLTVSTFIDPNGVIRGIDIEADEDNGLRAIIGKEDDEIGGEIWFKEHGKKEFNVDLKAVEDGDAYNGSIVFSADGEEFEIEFEDFSVVNKERGYFDADVTFYLPDVDPIELKFEADDDSQSVAYDIFIDDTDYGTAILKWSTEDGAELELPDESNSRFVTEDTVEEDLKDYIDHDMIYNFAYDTLIKLGVDEKLADKCAGYVADDVFD